MRVKNQYDGKIDLLKLLVRFHLPEAIYRLLVHLPETIYIVHRYVVPNVMSSHFQKSKQKTSHFDLLISINISISSCG